MISTTSTVPSVEAEVTASHESGSGCTEINMRMMISTASMPKKRGFQHVYRTKIMPSSLRIHAAQRTTVESGAP